MAEALKNLKAVVDIKHHPEGEKVHASWPVVIPAGRVVERAVIREKDLHHMLRNGHVVETSEAVTGDEPVAPAADVAVVEGDV